MDILVIEDNQALGEAIRELLADAGHTVRVEDDAASAAESIAGRKQDLTIVDADMNGGLGLTVIDSLGELPVEDSAGIIVLKGMREKTLSDNRHVRATIAKPFSASELLDAVEAAAHTRPSSKDRPSEGSGRRRLFRRKKHADRTVDVPVDNDLEFGESYILFRDNPQEIYKIAARFGAEGCDLQIITAGRKKAMNERFRGYGIEVVHLSVEPFDEFSDVYRLGTLLNQVRYFVDRSERPVVIFDDLNAVIRKNGMNQTFVLIREIMSADYDKPFSLLVSTDARGYSDKDKRILENHLQHIPGKTGSTEAV